MEQTPASITNVWQFAGYALGVCLVAVGGYIKLRTDRNGNGSKPITKDKLDLAILRHCKECERIGEIKGELGQVRTDIRGMREEMQQDRNRLHERLDFIYTKMGGK